MVERLLASRYMLVKDATFAGKNTQFPKRRDLDCGFLLPCTPRLGARTMTGLTGPSTAQSRQTGLHLRGM